MEGGGYVIKNVTVLRRPSCQGQGLLSAAVRQRLQMLQAIFVQSHVGVKDVLDHALAHGGSVCFGQHTSPLQLRPLQQFERSSEVVILEHRGVIVRKGERRLRVHEEHVVDTGVIDVMNDGGDEQGQRLHRWQRLKHTASAHEAVRALSNIGCVHGAMIGVVVVQSLHLLQKSKQSRVVDSERVDHAALV